MHTGCPTTYHHQCTERPECDAQGREPLTIEFDGKTYPDNMKRRECRYRSVKRLLQQKQISKKDIRSDFAEWCHERYGQIEWDDQSSSDKPADRKLAQVTLAPGPEGSQENQGIDQRVEYHR